MELMLLPTTYLYTVSAGEEYHYSTHAWTLVSAVIENVSGEKFLPYMKKSVFAPLAMSSTGGEFHKPLLYNRARLFEGQFWQRLTST